MKKLLFILLIGCLLFLLGACAGQSGETENNAQSPASQGSQESGSGGESEQSNILVAYFSATNHTEGVAEKIADHLRADLYEILPEEPYTDEDLNYNTDCRANQEQNDDAARPAISGSVEDMTRYSTVFIGYPIWWGQAPKIIYTFLESYDLAGKYIVPFCTSGSSDIGSSASNMHRLAGGSIWLEGKRFSGEAGEEEIVEWLDSLSIFE